MGLEPGTSRSSARNIRNGDILEKCWNVSYLGDMLNADGGVNSAVVARARCAWKKFRELSTILTFKRTSLKLKRKALKLCLKLHDVWK